MATSDVELATPQRAAADGQRAADTNGDLGAGPPVPRLAAGVELIGEFEGSGFKTPPYIARRGDGQVVQMPRMLFALAEQIDGHADADAIAERFSHAIERHVKAADVQMLIDEQLRPLGIVVATPEDEERELGKVDPLLALKFRAAVVPDHAVRSLTTLFRPLFLPPVMAAVVLAFVGLDGWLFFVHGVSQSLRHVLYQPALMLMLIGGVVLATAFHEIGHATACRYGGAKPGVMGVGVYIVWPAFYTDITDAYRLGKWGRLRTDVGGMYFNAIFALLAAGAYALTSFEPLLLLVLLQTFAIMQQALPFLRLDGYYILSDLTGVPDIYLRIRPLLRSLVPGGDDDGQVSALRSWVRVVVTTYVVAMAAFLLVAAVGIVINLPRVVATGYDSSALHFQAIGPDFSHGQAPKGALDVVETLFLILPAAGLVYTGIRIFRRAGGGAVRWSAGSPVRQGGVTVAVAGLIALAAFSWWPNGEYRPIQPGERGTLAGLVGQVRSIPSGRPSLTSVRQRQLGGAPTERARPSAGASFGASQSSGSRARSATPAGSAGAGTAQGAQTTPTTTPQSTQSTSTPAAPAAGDTTTTSTSTTTTTTTASSPSTPAPAPSTTTTTSTPTGSTGPSGTASGTATTP